MDWSKIPSPQLFCGDEKTAYRDPAVYYKEGVFYLFCTKVDCCANGPFLTTVETTSSDLVHWSEIRELTPRDKRLNYSSPGNVVEFDGAYYLCLQTYCRENGEKYGNERSRIHIMRSVDLVHWETPRLLRVKGDDVAEEDMGRMIDPFLLRDKDDAGKWWCLFKQNGLTMSWSRDLMHWQLHGRADCGENVCALVENGEYVLYHSPRNGIGVKRSKDLVHFEDAEPLITLCQSEWDWAKGRLTAGFVLDLRAEPSVGKMLLFFHGSGPEDEETMFDRHASIGLAWSDDGRDWQWGGMGRF